MTTGYRVKHALHPDLFVWGLEFGGSADEGALRLGPFPKLTVTFCGIRQAMTKAAAENMARLCGGYVEEVEGKWGGLNPLEDAWEGASFQSLRRSVGGSAPVDAGVVAGGLGSDAIRTRPGDEAQVEPGVP